MDDIPPRIAVLEQIAAGTERALTDIRAEMRELRERQDRHFQYLVARMDRQFYWTIGGFVVLLGTMAHGFHWI